MNRKNLKRNLKQLKGKNGRNAHETGVFDCPATPALTPPASLCDDWKSVVRAGLLDSRIIVDVGVKNEEEVKIKIESQKKSQNQSQRQQQNRGNPPVLSLTGLARFSTPFPEGWTLWGPLFINLRR